jgi:hypothetical protein
MSKKKTKSTQQSTTVQTPNVPNFIRGPYEQFTGNVQGLLAADPSSYSVGSNANQQQAFSRASAMGNNPMLAQGQNALQGLLGFTPQQVSAQRVSMADNSYDPAQLAGADLSAYMSPFQSDVIDASMRDYDNLLGMTFNQLKAQTPMGAYGGSRQGVAMGQAGADAARDQARAIANLRQAGFQNAQGAAFQDIGARNQFMAQRNADNLSTQQYNAGQDMAAQQFNSQQGLAGANFNAGIANNMFANGLNMDANDRANIGLLSQMGDREREIAIANNPELQRLGYLSSVGGLLGMVPTNAFTGQTVNETGTGKTNSTGISFGWSPKGGFSIGG